MKIDKVKVYDLEESIEASKYPMAIDTSLCTSEVTKRTVALGKCDKGEGHDNFLKGIRVSFDLTFTNKAWVEMERYTFVDIISSQSTMHRITKLDIRKCCNKYVWDSTILKLEEKVKEYNDMDLYSRNSTEGKELYLEILYNVPSGFQLTARLSTNYCSLKTIYSQRKNHRLPEWREFCDWILTLPHFNKLVLGDE